MDQLFHQIIAFVIILITGAVLDGPAFTIKIIAFVFNTTIIPLKGDILPSLVLIFWVMVGLIEDLLFFSGLK